MLLKTLTVSGIFDDSALSFDFITPKKTYKKKDVEQILTGLTYAFLGDPVLAHGKVELTFDHNGEVLLVRDFKENTASLKTADKTLEGEKAVDGYLLAELGIDKKLWPSFFPVKADEMYEKSFERTADYFTSVLAGLNIDEGIIEKAVARFKNKLQEYREKDSVLLSIEDEYEKIATVDRLDAINAEIAALQQNRDDLKDAVLLGEKAQNTAKELQKTEKELADLVSGEKKTEKLRARLKESEHIKEQLVAVRKSAAIITENDGLKPIIDEKKEALDKMVKEADAGERVMKKKQSAYIKVSARVESLYAALSELISDNVSSGKSDGMILSYVDKHFAELESAVVSLREKEANLLKELEKAETEVAVCSKQCNVDAVVKAFAKLQDFNRAQLNNFSDRLDALTSENGEKTAALIAEYHAAEKKKDDLFRTYILSDNILREIEAIDEKINENNVAVRNQQENLDALENAKRTLVGYLEKCNKKVDAADAEIFKLNTRKQYYNEINGLEYGNHCPVCNMPVIDKADNSAAMAALERDIRKQEDEIASYRTVSAEYTEKLDEINVRIGALRAKTDTGRGYVDSLEQSKLSKIAVLKKLYAAAGVRTQEELVTLLESTVSEVSQASVVANELKGLTQSAFIAGENVSRIDAFIKELNGADGGEPIAQGRNKLIALEKKEELAFGAVSGIGETAEGDAYENLQAALERRKALQKELSDVQTDLITYQSRTATVVDGEKEFTYGQLCIAYAGKQYISIVEQIREKEEEKKTLINEISALNGILKEKREAIEKEEEDVRVLEAHFKNNLDYLETIQNDGEYDDLFRKNKVSDLESKILSEGEADAMRREVEEYDKKSMQLQLRIEALQKTLDSIDTDETLVEKREALPRAEDALEEKKAELSLLLGEATIAKTLRDRRKALSAEAKLYKENYTYLCRVYDDSAVILKDTINYALSAMLPKYSVDCKGSGLVLKEGRKEMTTINDEVYSVLLVAMADAFRYVVSGILDCEDIQRMVTLKANSVGDDVKKKIDSYAKAHNILVLYVK